MRIVHLSRLFMCLLLLHGGHFKKCLEKKIVHPFEIFLHFYASRYLTRVIAIRRRRVKRFLHRL